MRSREAITMHRRYFLFSCLLRKYGHNCQIPVIIFITVFLAFLSLSASADTGFESIIISGKDGNFSGRLLISKTRYLFKKENQGKPVSLLVDIEDGQTTLITPQKQTYCNIPSISRESLELNPIEVFCLTSGFYTRSPDGRENINGFDCKKVAYLSHGQRLITAWFLKDISIPVKVICDRFPEMNFELQQIQDKEITPGDLNVPEGYQKISCVPNPEQSANEWIINAGASETVTIGKGENIELKVTDDESDGVPTRGIMVFIRDSPPPIDRVKAPLKLPNGKSIKLAYPASDNIKAIEFHISGGRIHIKRIKP